MKKQKLEIISVVQVACLTRPEFSNELTLRLPKCPVIFPWALNCAQILFW